MRISDWSSDVCSSDLACDIVLASDTARFAQIFRNIGLVPDGGSVWLLRQHIGVMRAKEIVYSGRMVGVDEAERLGLVREKVDSGRLLARARDLAAAFAEAPTRARARAQRPIATTCTPRVDPIRSETCNNTEQ